MINIRLVQDLFTDEFIDKIKTNTFLIDENGDFILDDLGEKVFLDNLVFYCSTFTEFVCEIEKKIEAKEAFPFIFIPSGQNVDYSNRNSIASDVEIREIFICSLTDVNQSAKDRDIFSFKRILFPLLECFQDQLRKHGQTLINEKNSHYDFEQHHTYSTDASNFQDLLDVIIIKNIKFKIKNC